MSGKTSIEWATMTWNPTTGCTRVSAGCDHCYAFEWHDRRRHVPQLDAARRAGYRTPAEARVAGAALPFGRQYDVPYSRIQLLPDRLEEPGGWRRPELVFVDSMADLMHEGIGDRYLDRVFEVMESVDRHVYFVLTKRPDRFAPYLRRRYRGSIDGSGANTPASTASDRARRRGGHAHARRSPDYGQSQSIGRPATSTE